MGKSLRERLARFDRAPAPPARPAREPGAPDPLLGLYDLGARPLGEGETRCFLIEEELGAGAAPGAPGACIDAEAWWRLCGEARPPRGPLGVIDTETTGLESGAGALVFLVGLLVWDEGRLRLLQWFLPEPAGEERMLGAMLDELDGLAGLVSYNGRGFDLPRLRNRLRMHRLPEEALARPHLDLLHPARRLFRHALEDCRQPRMEELLLGTRRHDDLPGSEAPAVYQALLHEGRDAGLARVASHNRSDLLGLLGIAGRMAGLVSDPLGQGRGLPGSARLATARLLAARGRPQEAQRVLEELAARAGGRVQRGALWELGLLHRRAGRWREAHACFAPLARRGGRRVEALVELAKLEEHRLSRPRRALVHAQRALAELDARAQLGGASPRGQEQRQAVLHRLRRLQRRCGRLGGLDG